MGYMELNRSDFNPSKQVMVNGVHPAYPGTDRDDSEEHQGGLHPYGK